MKDVDTQRAFFGQQVLLSFCEPESENRKTAKPPALAGVPSDLWWADTVVVRSTIGSEYRQ